ncbi:hypothetical protein O6H91_12G013000 [Diphasiastrum complanatum]|uniref:Uncharacterized protein n=1 Tax=Diphasiastrum complanatum TaxID=34168 RepID=A0ACC2BYW3_DIPCM|nr:hypothetical protein O6H91_12G013000 [Diphasiastrum complanatum]
MEISHVSMRHFWFTLGIAFCFLSSTWCADSSHLSGGKAVERRTTLVGGKQDVPNFQSDPEVQEAAKFAVREYTRQQKLADALTLWKVLSAKYQVVEGKMYYLTLLAGSGKHNHKYEAKVWVKPGKYSQMSLEDFKLISS